MAIVAPSMRALQKLLNICSKYCLDWDIKLNTKKSKLMFFGKNDGHLAPVTLQGVTLEFVQLWSNLGINVCSGRSFSCSVTEKIRKYYKCVNAILRTGNCSETILLRLIEAHAVMAVGEGGSRGHRMGVRSGFPSRSTALGRVTDSAFTINSY